MNYRVVEYRAFNGEKKADVIDKSGLPVSMWITAYLHGLPSATNTVITSAYQICYFLDYFRSAHIDILERIENGRLLSTDEIEQFIHTCRFKKGDSKGTIQHILQPKNLSRKSLDSMIYATEYSNAKVASSTTKLRLTQFKRFLEFLYTKVHVNTHNQDSTDHHFKFYCLISDLGDSIKKIKESRTVSTDPFEKVLPTESYFKLLDIIKPSNENNPFTKLTALRNYIIIRLFTDTGCRIGSIAKIKVSDLRDDTNPRVLITRSPNDPTDNRQRAPATKTRPHSSAISRELMSNIKLYIQVYRGNFPDSQLHDFLLISLKGKTAGNPIGIKDIQYILNRLSAVIQIKIHPHLLRYKWNEVFSEKAKIAGYTPDQIEDLRKYACGWSETSEMSAKYNEFRQAMSIQTILATEQSKFIPSNRSIIREKK